MNLSKVKTNSILISLLLLIGTFPNCIAQYSGKNYYNISTVSKVFYEYSQINKVDPNKNTLANNPLLKHRDKRAIRYINSLFDSIGSSYSDSQIIRLLRSNNYNKEVFKYGELRTALFDSLIQINSDTQTIRLLTSKHFRREEFNGGDKTLVYISPLNSGYMSFQIGMEITENKLTWCTILIYFSFYETGIKGLQSYDYSDYKYIVNMLSKLRFNFDDRNSINEYQTKIR